MTFEQVVQLGKIQQENLGMFSQFSIGIVLLIVALLTMGIIGFHASKSASFLCILFGLMLFWLFAYAIPEGESERIYEEKIEHWKKNVAYPYINGLKKEQKEVLFIKIDPELTSEVLGFEGMDNGSTTSNLVERTPVVVSYKDNGIVTRADWIPTHMELTPKAKPYIEFQRLNKDLGHGISKGNYNPMVYLPESYTFTEIK